MGGLLGNGIAVYLTGLHHWENSATSYSPDNIIMISSLLYIVYTNILDTTGSAHGQTLSDSPIFPFVFANCH